MASALVLGGGPAGIAWELGLLVGLRDGGTLDEEVAGLESGGCRVSVVADAVRALWQS